MIADEAWHYARFLEVAVREHPERLVDAPEIVGRVRRAEGASYGATFVLDHDDPVYDAALYDEAQRLLLRQFQRASARSETAPKCRKSGVGRT